MAQIPNQKALTSGDGLNDYVNVNTVTKQLQLPNGMQVIQYADNYVTPGLQLTGSHIAPLVSATSQVLTTGGTITTQGVGIARINPAAAVTGIILQPGTFNGQLVTVLNESAFNATMATAGTSNVADGTSSVVNALTCRTFIWDAAQSLWFRT